MPSHPRPQLQPGREAKKHIAEAHENYQRYARLLENPDDVKWALVLLFYSALHLVQARAIAKCPLVRERVPGNHKERGSYIAAHLLSIEDDYFVLRNVSEQARYKLSRPGRAEVESYHDREFVRIRERLASDGIAWRTGESASETR